MPHPHIDPAGHSYRPPGEAEPPFPARMQGARWRESRAYLEGVDLYNHGFFWEAHEVWEGLWNAHGKRGVEASFLQGLIQVSAAMLKMETGEREGARRLLERARANFVAAGVMGDGGAAGRFAGVSAPALMEGARARVEGERAGAPEIELAD
jgi:hypothetical protein